MRTIAPALYRLAVSLWVGGIALFTFIVTPVLFRSMGRDAAGKIVGIVFPYYFQYLLVLAAIALLARVFSRDAFGDARRWAGTLLIVTAILCAGYQAYVLTPEMEKVKRSIVSFETEPPGADARKEFSRLHGISMVLNLILLLDGAFLVTAPGLFLPKKSAEWTPSLFGTRLRR